MPRKKKKTTKRKSTTKQNKKLNNYLRNLGFAIFFILVGLISLFSSYDSIIGKYSYIIFSKILGENYKYIFSPIIIILGIVFILKDKEKKNNSRIIGLFLYLVSVISLIGFFKNYNSILNTSNFLNDFVGKTLGIIFMTILLLGALYLMFNISYKEIVSNIFGFLPDLEEIKDNIETRQVKNEKLKANKKAKKEEVKKQKEIKIKNSTQLNIEEIPKNIPIINKKDGILKNIFKPTNEEENKNSDQKTQINASKSQKIEVKKDAFIQQKEFEGWKFPSIDLLNNIGGNIKFNQFKADQKQDEIEEKLSQFKINVNMTGYRVGPTVIQYRLKPDDGVKLNKIVNLKNDLTLALHAKSIRIQAPIPGEGEVGIEVPNEERQAVGLKEVITSTQFNNKKLDIPLAVGKDVSGNVIVGDLTKMPHLLVAGQTASGKSVGMNGFILSMLYKFTPSELKMIMIDPKMVELSIYNGIPHLLTPVITNPDKALNSLKWAVAEMLRRYDLAKSVNARNLKEYNAKVKKDDKLPYIVIIVDELADLMMSGNKKEVEGSIARIAQMARAVGMHLIIATQRPSVDVITGLIKANVPSRIAFTVASQIDSRTVIDKAGAEDLLGRGDMLYFPTGNLEPERVQGVLVETDEIEAIVNEMKLTIDPEMINNLYDDSISNGVSKTAGSILENYNGDQEEDPEIIEKAISIVREQKKGSTSLIQRKLGLGYARAAKVLDILEDLGVVGPPNGSKPREVYD